MSSFRLFALSVFLILGALIVSGCGVNTVAPARSLADAVAGYAYDPAVAVERDSTKHFVWQDCNNSNACSLIYYRTKMGSDGIRVELPLLGGDSYINSDIAVDGAGTAWIVWRVRSGSYPDTTYRDYYTSIPADVETGSHPQRSELAQPSSSSAGRPRVAARGDVAYAVYETYNEKSTSYEQDSSLHYRMLAGGSEAGLIHEQSGTINSDAALAIDVNGALHVAWLLSDWSTGSFPQQVTYAHNSSGSMSARAVTPMDTTLKAPTIAVDSKPAPTAYVATSYTDSTGPSERVYVWSYQEGSAGTSTELDMPVADHWDLDPKVALAVVNDRLQLAFSALHDKTDSMEIWHAALPNTSPDRITNDSVHDGVPLLVAVEGRADDGSIWEGPVITWRQWTATGSWIPTMCYGDVFAYFEGGTHLLAPDQGGCNTAGQAAAASGKWAATIWLEQSADDSRQVPWIDFNAHLSRSPLVLR